jgi:hypothetical protein
MHSNAGSAPGTKKIMVSIRTKGLDRPKRASSTLQQSKDRAPMRLNIKREPEPEEAEDKLSRSRAKEEEKEEARPAWMQVLSQTSTRISPVRLSPAKGRPPKASPTNALKLTPYKPSPSARFLERMAQMTGQTPSSHDTPRRDHGRGIRPYQRSSRRKASE